MFLKTKIATKYLPSLKSIQYHVINECETVTNHKNIIIISSIISTSIVYY